MIVNGYNCVAYAYLRGAVLQGANLQRADLQGADLQGAYLQGADLQGADLRGAYLQGADLQGADLRGANLRGAYLQRADLQGADLRGAYLQGAVLQGADLQGAYLQRADLQGADLQGADLQGAINIPDMPWTIIVPEGELVVYKKTTTGITKLRIPEDALRSNGTGRKCRASKAYVLECPPNAASLHDPTFYYHVGCEVVPREPFCEDRWNECASGIHFFLTRQEAENY